MTVPLQYTSSSTSTDYHKQASTDFRFVAGLLHSALYDLLSKQVEFRLQRSSSASNAGNRRHRFTLDRPRRQTHSTLHATLHIRLTSVTPLPACPGGTAQSVLHMRNYQALLTPCFLSSSSAKCDLLVQRTELPSLAGIWCACTRCVVLYVETRLR